MFTVLIRLLLPRRAKWPRRRGGSYRFALLIRIWGLRLRVLNICQTPAPVLVAANWGRTRYDRGRGPPLRAWRCSNTRRLVLLRVYILWDRSAMLISHARTGITEKRQPRLDVNVVRIQVSSSLIGVQRVCSLIVTRFVLSSGVSLNTDG